MTPFFSLSYCCCRRETNWSFYCFRYNFHFTIVLCTGWGWRVNDRVGREKEMWHERLNICVWTETSWDITFFNYCHNLTCDRSYLQHVKCIHFEFWLIQTSNKRKYFKKCWYKITCFSNPCDNFSAPATIRKSNENEKSLGSHAWGKLDAPIKRQSRGFRTYDKLIRRKGPLLEWYLPSLSIIIFGLFT